MSMKSFIPSVFGKNQSNANPFQALHQQIDRIFEDFGHDVPRSMSLSNPFVEGMNEISVNVSETDRQIEVTAEIPGVEQNEINVTLMDDVLTITAEKSLEKETKDEEDKKNYHLVERSYGSFWRSLRLPFAAESDDIEASFKNGVLKLVIRKPEEAQQKTQKISIT